MRIETKKIEDQVRKTLDDFIENGEEPTAIVLDSTFELWEMHNYLVKQYEARGEDIKQSPYKNKPKWIRDFIDGKVEEFLYDLPLKWGGK